METGAVWSFEPSPDGSLLLLAAGKQRQPWLLAVGEPTGNPADNPAQNPTDNPAATMIELDGSVQYCVWHPDGERFFAMVDPDGQENNQIVLVDPATGKKAPVTTQKDARNELAMPYTTASSPVSPDGRWLAYATNRRIGDRFDIVIRDLGTGAEQTVLTSGDQVPADRYFPMAFSWDSQQLIAIRLHQNTEQDLYAIDLASNEITLLTPHDGPAKYFAVAARPEGIYLCATRDGNFTGLALLNPDGTTNWIDTPDHDIDCATLSADGSTLAWGVNQAGFTEIRYCSTKDRLQKRITSLPRSAYTFEKCLDGRSLRLTRDGSTLFAVDGTGALWSTNLNTGAARRLAGPAPATSPPHPDVVAFASGDGTTVSALVYRPDQPNGAVVLNIHGGPEVQAIPVMDPLTEGLLARGITVVATNIRGSSGYGLRFQRLIYRDWGGGDVEDLRAAAEFIQNQPWADRDRIGVYGASYGGFASLSCLTRLPEYWRAGVSECGVCDLVADIKAFPPTWRRRSKEWIGDIDDPRDRQRLTEASPIAHVDGLRAPLLLVHGSNDTRVSIESSDTLYARLTELGRDVTYERIDGAGHDISQQRPGIETLICDWLAARLSTIG
jgi:dipeptidyl aminopeptidase/acylaminoacyl peptidase